MAIKDYDQDGAAKTTESFDTIKTEFNVNTAIAFRKGDYIQIDEEKMLISSITGNRIKVKRAQYGSTVKPHDTDVFVHRITIQDDTQLIDGDDFGFGVTRTDFGDGNVWSSSQGRDSDL